MRRSVLVACAAALAAGCSTPVAEMPLVAGEATALSLSASCVSRGAPFEVVVTVRNPQAEAGRVAFVVHVQQFGNVAARSVELAAGESRTFHLPATIDFAGVWDVYVTGLTSYAEQRAIRVVDPATTAGC